MFVRIVGCWGWLGWCVWLFELSFGLIAPYWLAIACILLDLECVWRLNECRRCVSGSGLGVYFY